MMFLRLMILAKFHSEACDKSLGGGNRATRGSLNMIQFKRSRFGETPMFAKTIDVQTSQADLKELITLIREGAEIILTEGDTVVARVLPVEPPTNPRIPNLYPDIWVSDDFDDPLLLL